ncbi:MAG: MGMT family protein [Candidatus Woesearchaeota archaeon]
MSTLIAEKVYRILKKVPQGKVVSYKELARVCKTSPRAIGRIMNKNPYAPIVPCHRVVNADGRVGGYSGGLKKKIALLKKEGIKIKNNKIEKRFFKTWVMPC